MGTAAEIVPLAMDLLEDKLFTDEMLEDEAVGDLARTGRSKLSAFWTAVARELKGSGKPALVRSMVRPVNRLVQEHCEVGTRTISEQLIGLARSRKL